ncbi:MAG: alkaline phosphatase family protein [archaeon]
MKQAPYDKVLIIGIDAMDPKMSATLMKQGILPNFKKLSELGTFGELASTYPPETPVSWTTIATGKNPGKHGIFDFIDRDTNDYMPRLSITKQIGNLFGKKYISSIKTIPFWDITSSGGIPTSVLRWPVTFPPGNIKGNMLSGLGTPDIKGFLSGSTFYTTDKDARPPEKSSNKLKIVENIDGSIITYVEGPAMQKQNQLENLKSKMLIEYDGNNTVTIVVDDIRYDIKENEWSSWIRFGFDSGMFSKVHGIGKAYLKSVDPFMMYLTAINIDPSDPLVKISYPTAYSKELTDSVGLFATLGMPEETDGFEEGYIDTDAYMDYIQSLEIEKESIFWKEFEKFNSSDKAVFAFVFDASDRLQHVIQTKDKELSDHAEIVSYYIQKDKLLGKILDKIDNSTLLLVVSDHGFSHFDQEVGLNNWLVENGFMTTNKNLKQIGESPLFREVDWSKTKAYSLGFTSIFVNEKGRESKGIVEDKKQVVNDIVSDLMKLKDHSGKSVFNGVYKKEDIYQGEYAKDAPDIVVGYNPGFRTAWQSAIGGFAPAVITDNDKKWRGDHLIDPKFVPGVLFSNAKLKENASGEDVAPTILAAIGIEPLSDMDGNSLLK